MITKHNDGSATILAYGGINEFEISSKGIAQSLADLEIEAGANIDLRIHSYGGSVFEAAAIISSLKPYNVTATVDGIAASAAATIALSADTLKMNKGTQLMIHNPWTMAFGEAEDLRKQADILDKIKSDMIEIYKARIGEDAGEKMDEETWYSADEAKEAGIIDEVIEGYTKPSALVVQNEKVLNFDLDKTRFVAVAQPDEYYTKLDKQNADNLNKLAEQATLIADLQTKLEVYEELEATFNQEKVKLEGEVEEQRKRADIAERKVVSIQASTVSDPADAGELNQESAGKQTAWQKYQSIQDADERREFFTKNKTAIFATQPKG